MFRSNTVAQLPIFYVCYVYFVLFVWCTEMSLVEYHFNLNVDTSLGFVTSSCGHRWSVFSLWYLYFSIHKPGLCSKTLCVASFLLSIFELCFDSTRACVRTCFACDFRQLGNRCQTHYFPQQSCNLTHMYYNLKNKIRTVSIQGVYPIYILSVPPSSLYFRLDFFLWNLARRNVVSEFVSVIKLTLEFLVSVSGFDRDSGVDTSLSFNNLTRHWLLFPKLH